MLSLCLLTADLWVMGAKFEYQCGQVQSARHLLLKGIQYNPTSKQLWLEVSDILSKATGSIFIWDPSPSLKSKCTEKHGLPIYP